LYELLSRNVLVWTNETKGNRKKEMKKKKCECEVGRNMQEKESVDNEQKKEKKLVYYLIFITVYGWNEFFTTH
jgi:hypothetical protein